MAARLLVLALTGTIWLLAGPGARAAAASADGNALAGRPADPPPSLEAIMDQVRRTTRLIDAPTRVRQLYRAQAFGRTWDFEALVTKESDRVVVQSEDAPWFLPRRLQLDVVQVVDLLDGYHLRLVPEQPVSGSTDRWVIEGVPAAGRSGARYVRFWVERATGLVTHLELAYWWGRVLIDQGYQRVGAYTVLDWQNVRIEPLHVQVHVRYREYRFGS
ncbi:MAG: hypothetical protein IMX02_10485 [Limnochordaceae bacterium]|nr:hypothetical protein [Limnochordaceae bacterium]